jgi:DNA modification methylase
MELYQGDCLKILPTIAAGSVDLVVADLPYGVTSQEWDQRIRLHPLWEALGRVLKLKGVICLFATQPYAAELVCSRIDWFREELIWVKTRAANYASAKRRHMKLHELVLVFSRSPDYTYHPQKFPARAYKQRTQKPRTNTAYGEFKAADTRPNAPVTDRYPGTILHYKSPRQQDLVHPTQKPIALEEHLIRSYSNPGELVLDPCFGSGATGHAARNTGREFLGIEGDPGYYQEAAFSLASDPVPAPEPP